MTTTYTSQWTAIHNRSLLCNCWFITWKRDIIYGYKLHVMCICTWLVQCCVHTYTRTVSKLMGKVLTNSYHKARNFWVIKFLWLSQLPSNPQKLNASILVYTTYVLMYICKVKPMKIYSMEITNLSHFRRFTKFYIFENLLLYGMLYICDCLSKNQHNYVYSSHANFNNIKYNVIPLLRYITIYHCDYHVFPTIAQHYWVFYVTVWVKTRIRNLYLYDLETALTWYWPLSWLLGLTQITWTFH